MSLISTAARNRATQRKCAVRSGQGKKEVSVFGRLIAAWRSKDPLKENFEQLIAMSAAGEWMFEAAWSQVLKGSVDADVKTSVLHRDAEVNENQRSIRRHLVEHLAVQPGADVPACLVLMSVVKDAERVGDYCKDLLDAAGIEKSPITECSCFDEFQEVYGSIRALFGRTREALEKSDRAIAEEVMRAERGIGKRCNDLVTHVAALDVPCAVGVPWALIARYLKRMAAHLSNVASSMVMPLHKIDTYDEGYLGGNRKKK
jgi:phosphate uptake regulator